MSKSNLPLSTYTESKSKNNVKLILINSNRVLRSSQITTFFHSLFIECTFYTVHYAHDRQQSDLKPNNVLFWNIKGNQIALS